MDKDKSIQLLYVYNPERAHKILPLMEKYSVIIIKKTSDIVDFIFHKRNKNYFLVIDTMAKFGLVGLFISKLLKISLITRLRGEIFREFEELYNLNHGFLSSLRLSYHRYLNKTILKNTKMIIFNSKYLSASMQHYAKGKYSTVVYNPYTKKNNHINVVGRKRIPQRGCHLLSVTNLDFKSKFQPTLDAILKWLPSGCLEEMDIEWVICGSGGYEKYFLESLKQSPNKIRIHYLGRVEDMTYLYKWCDVFIHFTKLDAFPNVTLEAMMYGKPIITNNDSCGTLEQVFDGKNGFIVNNTDSYLRALDCYLKDNSLRKRHGNYGRCLVESKYTVQVQRANMERAINLMLE